MRADVRAGERLQAAEYGEAIAVVDRQIERRTTERIIDATLQALGRLDDLALDEIFLPQRSVMWIAALPNTVRPSLLNGAHSISHIAELIGEADVNPVHLAAALADRREPRLPSRMP